MWIVALDVPEKGFCLCANTIVLHKNHANFIASEMEKD
jgi:hypothetical protein